MIENERFKEQVQELQAKCNKMRTDYHKDLNKNEQFELA